MNPSRAQKHGILCQMRLINPHVGCMILLLRAAALITPLLGPTPNYSRGADRLPLCILGTRVGRDA